MHGTKAAEERTDLSAGQSSKAIKEMGSSLKMCEC
jgi:hypothetical protein